MASVILPVRELLDAIVGMLIDVESHKHHQCRYQNENPNLKKNYKKYY